MSEREPGNSRDYGSVWPSVPAVGFADFSPTELYNLSESIANNVNSVNGGLRALEKMMMQIGGNSDGVSLREKIHTTQQSVNSSISACARELQRLGVVVRRGDKPQKLQVERLTQAFKESLAKYSVVQKSLAEKMQSHVPRTRQKMAPQSLEDQVISEQEEASLIANQQAQARLIDFETSMLIERETAMYKIEADVLDVKQIVQDLASMVHTQGEVVDSVESHIEAATSNVEAGVDELAKAAEHQRRYRRKMFILILIGIIIGILIIVFIVRSFR